MRTTVDIDETVLAAAKSLARAEGISLGRALSELAMRGLRGAAHGDVDADVDISYAPFPVIIGDGLVTDALVAEHRDD